MIVVDQEKNNVIFAMEVVLKDATIVVVEKYLVIIVIKVVSPFANLKEHAAATFALIEVYRVSNYNPLLRSLIEKALRYIVKKDKTEISEIVWITMALNAAKKAALVAQSFPVDKMEKFVVTNLDKNYYCMPQSSVVNTKTATAMAMNVLFLCGYSDTHKYLVGSAGIIDNSRPNFKKNIDWEYCFWSSIAMYKMAYSYSRDWREMIATIDRSYIQKILSNNKNSVANIAFITLVLQMRVKK